MYTSTIKSVTVTAVALAALLALGGCNKKAEDGATSSGSSSSSTPSGSNSSSSSTPMGSTSTMGSGTQSGSAPKR